MRILITGGAGFVGGNLAVSLATRYPGFEIVAFDNLMRTGSELNLPRLGAAGVRFMRGDVRSPEDLEGAGAFDALIECSAEPSVLAASADTSYSFHTNLVGAFNCLEAARRHDAFFVFISTSRVYPVAALESLAYEETDTRYALADDQPVPGASAQGIAESFPLEGTRTFYGATKLAAELLITEYAEGLGVDAVVERCGVIAGPWQMGRVDQGVFSWWLLSHLFGRDLSYIGFGGAGKQVRDLLHVEDLVDLVDEQLADRAGWSGKTVNVGGGLDCSLSLLETTRICRELTGREVRMGAVAETRPGDVPVFITDCARLHSMTSWRPRRGPEVILGDILAWAKARGPELESALFP